MYGRERVQSLMRKMGLSAIYPKPKLSKKDTAHSKYPYLLNKKRKRGQVYTLDKT